MSSLKNWIDFHLPQYYIHVGHQGKHQYLKSRKNANDKLFFMSYYKHLSPILQSGPECGLVALAMASSLFTADGVTPARLLDVAKKHAYTKQGEMFSALNMCHLAESILPCGYQSEVVENISEDHFLACVLQQDTLLVPYDCDKNFQPCLKNGHKAHWALIAGCLLVVQRSGQVMDIEGLEDYKDSKNEDIFNIRPNDQVTPSVLRQLNELREKGELEDVLLYFHHGKTKYATMCKIHDLLFSNAQLYEIEPKKDNDMDFVVPREGLQQSLSSKLVKISVCS